MPVMFSVMANPRAKTPGFTLIELMVALAVSLIVALSAVGFVVSLIKANTENLHVTRLTQELRSLSEVVSREVRRARYMNDPVGLIGSLGGTNHDSIDTSTAGCIIFSYDDPPNPPSPGVTVSRSIRLNGEAIFLNTSGSTCTGGAAISTPQVRITGLTFTRSGSRIDMVMTGALAEPPPALDGVERTFRQTIYVRSGEVD